jgi:hypothetical protein
VNFWTQGAWNTTLENIEFETYFEGGFFGRFIGLVGMSDNKLTLWIHAIEFSPVARNPGATSSMSASNVQKRLVLESLRFINAFAKRAGINNVELTGISNSVGYVDILPGLLDGLKNDISGPGLRPTSFTLLNSFDGARRVPPLVRPNDKPNAFVSTYLQGWRTPTNFLPETGNEVAPIEAATVPLGRGHVPVRDLDRAAPILMDMIKDVIDGELKSLEDLHWDGYQNTIQKALRADDPLSFWESSIRDISERILRWTEIFDPGAIPSINKILAKANGLGQDKGQKLIERTLINNQALADKVPHVAAFLYSGKKTYSYMKDFSKNHKEVTQREWEQTLAETAIDLDDVALSMRINFPTVEEIFDLWVIYRRDKSRLPLDFESFIAIWLRRPHLKEITHAEFDSKLLPLWKGAVLANVNPKSFQLRRSSELTAIYKRLRANLLHFLTFENITGGGVMNVMQKIHPTLQAEFKDRLARSGFDSPETIELLSLQTTAVITYYLRFKTSRKKVGHRSSTIDTFSLSQLTGDGYLKGSLPLKAEGEETNKLTDRHDTGRATSRWMTRFFESVGYLFGGEGGRRKAGEHFRDHAAIYEWTLGLGGMVVNLGVILFLSGSGLERAVAFVVGAGWGSLFYLSHFGVTTETDIKVSKRRAVRMAIIYSGLIFITPFPILEFLEYHSFASEFLLSVVGFGWLGALGLHNYFDKKESEPAMGTPPAFSGEEKDADGLSRDGHFWLKNFLGHQYELDITSVRSASTGDGDQDQKNSYFIRTRDGENFVFHLAGITLKAARAYVSAQLSPSLDGRSQPHFIRHRPHYDEKSLEDDYLLLWEGVHWVLERNVDHGNPLTHTPSVIPHGGRGEGVLSDERGQVTEIVLIELGSRPTDQNVNKFMSQAARLTVAEYSRRATQTSIPLSAPWSIEKTGTPVLIVDEGSVRTTSQRENLALLVKKHPHSAIITNATGLSVSGVGSALIYSRPGAFTQRQTQEGIPLGIWDVSLSSLEDEFLAIAQAGNGTGFRFMQTEVLHLNVEGLTKEQNSILEAAQRAWILNALFQLTLPVRSLDWTGIIETLTAIARYA